jgi:hypothetical protein
MSELFYPTIDLFIYDLRSPLNADTAEIADNLQAFRARLPQNIELKDIETEIEYLELTTPPRLKLNPVNPNLEGYLYPVRLNDAYGLQIDCSVNNLTEPQSTDSFNLIKAEIEQNSHQNPLTIGQTWLISGWLTEQKQDTENIARDCYKTLFKNDKWTGELYKKGTFLNSNIFEIWQAQSYASDHLIIILFPNQEIAEKAAHFYTDWMGLFCYRHKITWAYHQSRLIKEALVNHYKKVEENAKIIKNSQDAKISLTRLQQLFNNIQNILNKYTIDLLNLSFQKQIIEINLVNYRTRLELIKQKAGKESDLSFLDQFSNLAEKKYLPQIAKDNENMQLGLQLLQTNINALRSQIELEKSERDRNFQTLVTIIGTGTAGVAIIKEGKNVCEAILPNNYCKPPSLASLASPLILIVISGCLGLLAKKAIKRLQ